MTGEPEETTQQDASSGGRRDGPRRRNDRRQLERRAPPPLWRRPWAYIGYGVLAALVLVFALTRFNRPETPAPGGVVSANPLPSVDTISPPAAKAPMEDARSTAAYEELVARG
jgi:hypothetical protein